MVTVGGSRLSNAMMHPRLPAMQLDTTEIEADRFNSHHATSDAKQTASC